MGTATVEMLTSEEAERQRSSLLDELGMSLDELRSRAEEHLLTPNETAKWRRVEELTWLLGN